MKPMKLAAALAAVALSGAAAAAPSITMYGVVDTGLQYTHVSNRGVDTLEMNSGNYAGSRWGVKGEEKIGPSTVGFILESGLASDTGEQGKSGSLFNRESQVYVTGSWGTIGAGRVGAFTSGSSSLSRYWDFEPFETGYYDAGLQGTQVNVWRLNSNTLYYVSPKMNGFEFGGQYSFTGYTSDKETNGMARDSHFGNIYARWDGKNARVIAGVEADFIGHDYRDTDPNKTRWSAKLAGAWSPNAGPVTLFAGYNYYKNQDRFTDSTWDDDYKVVYDGSGRGLEGHAFFVGGRYSVGAANFLAQFQFLTGKNKGAVKGDEDDYKRYVGSLGVHYYFSKRTMGYGVVSYAKGTGLLDTDTTETNRVVTTVGVTHWF
ncbi:porin [Mesosutterella sp. OilRF-GAM-744-9]|uniref:Porin n=1 Tax=Mesosutterella porci TaxID=2915351 RepID=A0ABS9MP69_9BURK|nr:porin [Mesosutterella sp. oilRF-744-WT-GAM-9]MCG5030139.1 porin [Mesosutterella sp. oilRF-744-WT-GAM-9]